MPATKRRSNTAKRSEASPRQARLDRRREQSREEILAAARRVLLRNGVAATTLDAVAREIGMSKTALYYYFPSKDALFFELVFGAFKLQSQAIHDEVEKTDGGGEALRAIINETVNYFAPRLDDFRLAFLYGQVAGPSALHFNEEQFARIRPLNELMYGGAAEKLARERKKRPSRAAVEPRLMAFLAYLSAVGLLTMKGMVENLKDPLVYSDEQLIDGFARIFEAAAGP